MDERDIERKLAGAIKLGNFGEETGNVVHHARIKASPYICPDKKRGDRKMVAISWICIMTRPQSVEVNQLHLAQARAVLNERLDEVSRCGRAAMHKNPVS